MSKRRLTVYVRLYCHLCEEMLTRLHEIRQQHGFSLAVCDVDEDPTLAQRYGERVPVLVADDHEICHYYLDEPALLTWLAGRD